MPLTTALYTGLSGLTVSQTALDVIGNNIANVNTTAFKASRALFQPQFSETAGFGTPPGTNFGGTNPTQKGLGALVGSIQRDMDPGNIKPTNGVSDLAIEGQGLFVVEDSNRYYTRNGTFEMNAENYMTTAEGQYLMGFGVDSNYAVSRGQMTRMQIPLGLMTTANPTSKVMMGGSLRADGDIGTAGSIIDSQALNIGGGAIDSDTLLVDLREGTDAVFLDGDVLDFEGQRGERVQGPRTMTVDASSTVGDLMSFLADAFGINTDSTLNPPGGGEILDLGSGNYSFRVNGNVGYENRLDIGTGGLQTSSAQGTLVFTERQEAVGESVFTSMTVYDSLGSPVDVNLTFALESKNNQGSTWRFFANSPDDTDVSTVLGSGTVTFDTLGVYMSSTDAKLTVDRDGTGAITPLAIDLDMSNMQGLTVSDPYASVVVQDGTLAGTLSDFRVGGDGTIIGTFTNGMIRTLGQVALATFSNYQGLVDMGNSMYRAGPNSGEPVINAPLGGGAGGVIGGALETSNVDISDEFVDMIIASTGFSSASRVITTANQLLTELLSIVR